MQPRFLVIGLLLAALIILGLQYGGPFLERFTSGAAASNEASETVATAPERVQAPVAEPAVPVPRAPEPEPDEPSLMPPAGLDVADAWLREQLPTALDDWPEDMDWLRLSAAVLDNARRGQYPRNLLGFLAPRGPFAVTRDGEGFRVDPASYARYDLPIAALQRVPPDRAAKAFTALEPLLTDALGELGVTDVPPRMLLLAALTQIETLPAAAFDAPLVRPKVMYRYADPELESLPPLAKQLLRFGPEHVVVLQDWARRMRAALDG